MPAKIGKTRAAASKEIRLNVVLPKSQGLGWTPLRKVLSGVFPDVSLKSYASFATFGRAKAKGAILVPLLHPIEAVALQIAKTKTPEKALAAWMAEISDLLAEQRKKRTRVMLVPAGVFAEDGAALIAILSKKLKAHPKEDAALDVSVKPEIPVLDLIAAQYLLESSEAAGKLLERLHDVAVCPFASSVVDLSDVLELRDGAVVGQAKQVEETGLLRDNLSALLSEHKGAIADAVKLRAEMKAETDHLAKLSADLTARSKERDQARAETKAGAERLAQESAALARAKTEKAAVAADLDALTTERDLLRYNLAEIVSEFTSLQGQAAAQDSELDTLRGQVREQHLLKATNVALEQRIKDTEQRMAMRNALLGRGLLQEGLRREYQMAETQGDLDSVQDAMVSLKQKMSAQATLLKQAKAALTDAKKAAKTKEMSLQKELETVQDELAEGNALLKQLSDELNHIYTSKSWKITEPMRQTRARFQGRKS